MQSSTGIGVCNVSVLSKMKQKNAYEILYEFLIPCR